MEHSTPNESMHKNDLLSLFILILTFYFYLYQKHKSPQKRNCQFFYLPMSLNRGLLKNAALIRVGAKKSSTATFSHHLTFHIIWFDIMEPVALSSVQCLFQFEIHCLPDFTLICKCHLSRSRGNNLQWFKGKIYKKRRRNYERRRLNSKNHACLVILVFRRIGKLYLWVEEYFLLEEMHCDPV